MTATSLHNHIPEFFQDNIRTGVQVKNRDPRKFHRSTAGFWYCFWIHQMNQGLNNGMICSIQMTERK